MMPVSFNIPPCTYIGETNATITIGGRPDCPWLVITEADMSQGHIFLVGPVLDFLAEQIEAIRIEQGRGRPDPTAPHWPPLGK